jgi:molybdate transport system substrate-binding protein
MASATSRPRGVAVLLLGAGLAACSPGGPPPDLTVYAAASLTDVLAEVGETVAEARGVRAAHSFAASSTLARQILRGAPADVFLSASPEWVDLLEKEGRVEPGTRRDLLENRLVLVASSSVEPGPVSLEDVPEALAGGRLALADPEAVPAGVYARRALERLGIWETLRERVAPAADVRGALAMVERGECPFGVVYHSDAMGARVAVVDTVAEDLSGPIVYTAVVVAGRMRPEVRAYLTGLVSPRARAIFEEHGFRSRVIDLADPEGAR